MAYSVYGCNKFVNLAEPLFVPDAVSFDGTGDYLTRSTELANVANGTEGTISTFLRFPGSTPGSNWKAIFHSFHVTPSVLSKISFFWRGIGEYLTIVGYDSSNNLILNASGVKTYSGNTWYHALISWKLDAAGAPNLQFYVDDANLSITHHTPIQNAVIDYTVPYTRFGAGEGVTPNAFVNIELSEFWFDTSFIDISVESNRRKFITTDGKPVNLGVDGSTPTGTSPLIYMSGDASSWNAGTNSGAGGDFVMTGAVIDSTNEPVEI